MEQALFVEKNTGACFFVISKEKRKDFAVFCHESKFFSWIFFCSLL